MQSRCEITKKGGEIAMTTVERPIQKSMQQGIREGSYSTYFNLIWNMKKNDFSDQDI